MFPGACAKRRLEVIVAASTVLMWLALNSLDETITTGRRKPGSEPLGAGNDAHQISPFFTTSGRYLACCFGERCSLLLKNFPRCRRQDLSFR